jgi:hypothetical protein
LQTSALYSYLYAANWRIVCPHNFFLLFADVIGHDVSDASANEGELDDEGVRVWSRVDQVAGFQNFLWLPLFLLLLYLLSYVPFLSLLSCVPFLSLFFIMFPFSHFSFSSSLSISSFLRSLSLSSFLRSTLCRGSTFCQVDVVSGRPFVSQPVIYKCS